MSKVLLGLALLSLLTIQSIAQNHPGKPVAPSRDSSGWYPLFDGRTLSGWTATPAGPWRVDAGGLIVGEGKPSVLFSPSTYTNFEVKVVAIINTSGNSGIYFRSQPAKNWEAAQKYASADGYQAEIGANSEWITGTLGDGTRNLVTIPKQLVAAEKWFALHIAVIGNRMAIKVNDTITVDYIDKKQHYKSGHIGLQVHHLGTLVKFKDVKVKPLPDDEHSATTQAMIDMPGLPFSVK